MLHSKRNKSILIVDDETVIRNVLSRFIQRIQEFDIIDFAEDGDEAQKLIQENDYDVILIDNFMPKKNGLEVISTMKEKIKKEKTKVIFLSGDINPENELIANSLGINETIQKPITNPIEFINKVKKVSGI